MKNLQLTLELVGYLQRHTFITEEQTNIKNQNKEMEYFQK